VLKILVPRYVAECGRRFSNKKSCQTHEANCKCWTNPKYKTCKTCKFARFGWDSDDNRSWRTTDCENPSFDYDKHFTPAHEKAEDLCINCPIWQPITPPETP
jgi:hypothetical protein